MNTVSYSVKPIQMSDSRAVNFGEKLTDFGKLAIRYSVVTILLWIGTMKFTVYEATAIEDLVASSPVIAWLYQFLSIQATSNLIGTIEIVIALAILFGSVNRSAAVVGGLGAVVTFAITLSFLFSAPGWEASLGGFPALFFVPGQFLLKDLVLLAASISLLGKALTCQR